MRVSPTVASSLGHGHWLLIPMTGLPMPSGAAQTHVTFQLTVTTAARATGPKHSNARERRSDHIMVVWMGRKIVTRRVVVKGGGPKRWVEMNPEVDVGDEDEGDWTKT